MHTHHSAQNSVSNESSKQKTIANESGRDSEKEFNLWELEKATMEIGTLAKNNQSLIRTFQAHLDQGNVLQNRAVRLQALASLFTQNNEKIAKFEQVLREFKDRASVWTFEKEMLRLVEENAMFTTPKAVLDFLLAEAQSIIEDVGERREGEEALKRGVEEVGELGNCWRAGLAE